MTSLKSPPLPGYGTADTQRVSFIHWVINCLSNCREIFEDISWVSEDFLEDGLQEGKCLFPSLPELGIIEGIGHARSAGYPRNPHSIHQSFTNAETSPENTSEISHIIT